VEAHKARLMRKLGAGNLAELIRIVDLVDPARR
jgi:FixJ family two-component response regulator